MSAVRLVLLSLFVALSCGCSRADAVRVAEAGAIALELATPHAVRCAKRYRSSEPLASVERDCAPLERSLAAVRVATLALRGAILAADAGDPSPSVPRAIAELTIAMRELAELVARWNP